MLELGAHESRVGRDGLPDPVHRPRQLVLELFAHDLDQALFELLRLDMEIALGLTALVRQHEQSETGQNARRQDTGYIDRDRACSRYNQCPQPNRSRLSDRDGSNGIAHRGGQLARLGIEIVAIDLLLSPPRHRIQERSPVVAELSAHFADKSLFVLGQPPPVDVVGDAFPNLEILIDHPVDQLVDDRVDLLLGTGHDLPLELAPDLVLIQQIEDSSQPDRLLKKGIAPLQHAGNNVLDPGQVVGELPPHVLLVGDQLAIDVVDRRQIVAEYCQPLVRHQQVLLRDPLSHSQRAQQFEADTSLLIKGREDVLLEPSKPARLPKSRSLLRIARAERLRLLRQQRRNREQIGTKAEQTLDVLADELGDLSDTCFVAQEIDLVNDDDDLLPPVADRRHERPLALGERTVRGSHEEDQIGARHELLGELLVLANDGISPRRIDDRDLVEELRGVLAHDDPVRLHGHRWFGSETQQVDDRGRRCHALRHDFSADEGVDEGGLAGVELADDHQKEERDKMLRRAFDGVLVLLGRGVASKGVRKPIEQRQFVFDQLLLLTREERPRHRYLTVAAGASRKLEHASAHLTPIILRARAVSASLVVAKSD